MAKIIKSVSISEVQDEFLDRFNISPSEIIQDRINELINISNKTKIEIENLTTKLRQMNMGWFDVVEFIQDKEFKSEIIRIHEEGCKRALNNDS